MYHPYFRGKQFELITIRESAAAIAAANFSPVIEPVRESLGGLKRALNAIGDAGGNATVIVNPRHGDHNADGAAISAMLEGYAGTGQISAGILLTSDMSAESAMAIRAQHNQCSPVLIHAGFVEGKTLADLLGGDMAQTTNIFFENYAGKLYRKHFAGSNRVLLRDGFKKGRNADYAPVEKFSDLHVTYLEEGMNGFGDFLIVGNDYTEGGGPAYAVAIHLTFIDDDADDEMYVYHFVSETRDTPTDPAGKFGEALNSLIQKLNSGNSKLLETSAIQEFRSLHEKGHFPGLGYIKKLSMKHHIETLAAYFG